MKKIKFISYVLFSMFAFSLASCGSDDDVVEELEEAEEQQEEQAEEQEESTVVEWSSVTASPDTWDGEKRADISYQLLVYSFADSDGDGTGDFQGIIDKLDYLDDLGVSAIWLSPIHPAMSYHGYDVTDYTTVNEDYGTMSTFRNLITQAHNRGIKVYLDYVMNHTGSDHPWFTDAKSSEDSEYRDYYIFSQDPEADIKAGNIAMISSEGSSGYDSGEWYSTVASDENTIEGYYKFVLDWTNSSAPTVTVTEATASDVDADNPDTSTTNAKYLYYGDGVCKKFYDNGDGTYYLTVYMYTTWGFLIRTSTTTWDNGTKYGASSASSKVTLGEAFTLNNSAAVDILFDSQNVWYYHSHFQTSYFADLNYGAIGSVSTNPTYLAMVSAAKGWVDEGIDGLRLDAVKHIYHSATSSENPTFLYTFYNEMNTYYKSQGHSDDFYMVGEVLSEHNEVAPYYYGLPALFDFSYWYRLSWAINNNQGYYFAENIVSYQDEYASYRSDYIDAIKLSNHDEERTASTLGKSEAKEKLAAAVLLTSGGSPYIYYGEELGIYGTQTNGDEYVRSPMLWGDSYVTSYTSNIDSSVASNISSVSEQQNDETSLLNTYITFTELRNTYPALAEGTMSEHDVYNHSNSSYKTIAAWYMTSSDEKMCVIHNFGSSDVQLELTDDVEKAVAVSGDVYQKEEDGTISLKMGKYSSIVYLMAE